VGLELLKTGGNNLRQVALLVAVGNLDGLINLAVLQRAGNRRGEGAGLAAGGREGQRAVNHDADGPAGHDEQNSDDRQRRPCHLLKHREQIPADGGFRLLEEQDRGVGHVAQNQSCNVCENHELISSSELFETLIES
jgi:hypothetical protein